MTGDYKVTKVLDVDKPWSNDYGTFTTYPFIVEGVEKVVRWNRKHQNGQAPQGPTVGETISGELEDKGNYFKFKKAQGGGGGSGGGGSWRPTPPEEIAAMRRAGAQNRALEATKLAHEMGLLEGKVTNRDQLLLVLAFFTDHFDQDVTEVANAAKGSA